MFISSSSILIGPHGVSLSWVTWLAASRRPLKPNKRRRRCAPLLDSQIPLVHGTQTTGAGRVGAELGTAAQRKLICSLTDGFPSHTQPPDRQPASHVGVEQVGEGVWAEGRMIVIEYEMSISWNKHATPARRNIHSSLTYCGAFGTLVYHRYPAALSNGNHICATQGVNVMNMLLMHCLLLNPICLCKNCCTV